MKNKDVAKKRLKLILMTDRLQLEPSKLEDIKKELSKVLSKYFKVNDKEVDFRLQDHLKDPLLLIQAPLFKKSDTK